MKKLLACLFFVVILSVPSMAINNVKIATIGAVSPQFDTNMKPQQMVDGMIKFWAGELQQVLPDKPDLIVLPEVCDRPGGLTPEQRLAYYAVQKDQLLDYFRSIARANHCYIAYGPMRDIGGGHWRNSCVLVGRDGEIAGMYDKNFPTIGALERGTVAGTKADLIQLDFGTVGCAICFDLNFDELLRKYQKSQPDLIIFIGLYHGGLVQSYWAYTSRAYFVGSVGIVNLPSEIRNPFGEVVATSTNYFHFTVATVNLDRRLVHLDYNWAKLRALKQKYGDKVEIYDPGEVGAVMISSEHETVSADDMIREFDIELLDDYFNRSRAVRKEHLE
jgi:predicted amidohydrolase